MGERERTTHHRNKTDQPLSYYTPNQMSLEHRIVLSFRSVAVVEDIQRILQIKCPPTGVSDVIVGIRVHAINYCVEVFREEELANVGEP